MKTQKFVGKINGKVYNDVVEYKKALMNIDTTKSYTISCEYIDVEEENTKTAEKKVEKDEKNLPCFSVFSRTLMEEKEWENEETVGGLIGDIESLTDRVEGMSEEDMEKMNDGLFDVAEKFNALMGKIKKDWDDAKSQYQELSGKEVNIKKEIEKREEEISTLKKMKEDLHKDVKVKEEIMDNMFNRWLNIQKVDEAYTELAETFLKKLEQLTGKKLRHCIQ